MKKTIHILFQHDNPEFANRINYVLAFINNHPHASQKIKISTNQVDQSQHLKIYYGAPKDGFDFIIPSQKVFFNRYIPKPEDLISNQYLSKNHTLSSVEKAPYSPQPFRKENIFQFDIIETIFFHISRFEEWFYSAGRKDEHDRMDAKYQFLVKMNLHQKPVVDHLIFCFLKALGINVKNQKTQFRITHDIDFINKRNDIWGVIKSMGGALLKRRNVTSALRIWQNRFDKNPYDTFEWMLRKEVDFEKAIYFLVGGETKFDCPYDLDHPIFKKAIRLSKERGYKIGIHPSYDSMHNTALMEIETKKLEKRIGEKINITRQHFLRFSFHLTPKFIQKMGFEEDSSLGYADRIGFRCGTGFPYRLYDFENEKAFEFLETPLIFMDSALFAEVKNDPDLFQKIWKDFLKAKSIKYHDHF